MKTKSNTTKPSGGKRPEEMTMKQMRDALEAIHEAGRMSSQPRAVYCALIAEDALEAAKGGAQ